MPNNYKPLGGSPEIQEHFSNFVDDVKGQFGSAGKDFFSQLLGVSSDNKNTKEKQHPEVGQNTVKTLEKQAAKATNEIGKIEQVLFSIKDQIIGHQNSENTVQNFAEKAEVRPGIDYHKEYFDSITNFEKKAENRMQYEVNKKIKEITDELIRLIATTKVLKDHFGTVTVAPPPQKAGKYHENFFEWLLIMIKQARQKVENSEAWLGEIKVKKKKGYWDKAKDHGTTFTQSGERSTVTSTG